MGARVLGARRRHRPGYTDAAHIADGVIGLKQRSLAANDPTE